MALMVNAHGKSYRRFTRSGGRLIHALVGLCCAHLSCQQVVCRSGLKVWAIEAGNHLINFLLFGAILGAWR